MYPANICLGDVCELERLAVGDNMKRTLRLIGLSSTMSTEVGRRGVEAPSMGRIGL